MTISKADLSKSPALQPIPGADGNPVMGEDGNPVDSPAMKAAKLWTGNADSPKQVEILYKKRLDEHHASTSKIPDVFYKAVEFIKKTFGAGEYKAVNLLDEESKQYSLKVSNASKALVESAWFHLQVKREQLQGEDVFKLAGSNDTLLTAEKQYNKALNDLQKSLNKTMQTGNDSNLKIEDFMKAANAIFDLQKAKTFINPTTGNSISVNLDGKKDEGNADFEKQLNSSGFNKQLNSSYVRTMFSDFGLRMLSTEVTKFVNTHPIADLTVAIFDAEVTRLAAMLGITEDKVATALREALKPALMAEVSQLKHENYASNLVNIQEETRGVTRAEKQARLDGFADLIATAETAVVTAREVKDTALANSAGLYAGRDENELYIQIARTNRAIRNTNQALTPEQLANLAKTDALCDAVDNLALADTALANLRAEKAALEEEMAAFNQGDNLDAVARRQQLVATEEGKIAQNIELFRQLGGFDPDDVMAAQVLRGPVVALPAGQEQQAPVPPPVGQPLPQNVINLIDDVADVMAANLGNGAPVLTPQVEPPVPPQVEPPVPPVVNPRAAAFLAQLEQRERAQAQQPNRGHQRRISG